MTKSYEDQGTGFDPGATGHELQGRRTAVSERTDDWKGPQWKEDCIKYHGKVLTGEKAHWCAEWDFLPIDETTLEIQCCTCIWEKGVPER